MGLYERHAGRTSVAFQLARPSHSTLNHGQCAGAQDLPVWSIALY